MMSHEDSACAVEFTAAPRKNMPICPHARPAWAVHVTAWTVRVTAWTVRVTAWTVHVTAWAVHVTAWTVHVTAWTVHVTAWAVRVTVWTVHVTACAVRVTAWTVRVVAPRPACAPAVLQLSALGHLGTRALQSFAPGEEAAPTVAGHWCPRDGGHVQSVPLPRG